MQTLLPHKCPRLFEYVGELPKTGTGKIDRQTLKAHAIGQSETSGADARVTA
jgi:acyl-coenzyme A synthetase/AMP-(fatty) acid ligase